jgi:DNA-binding winged helix-turn-helix (wHTH) protein
LRVLELLVTRAPEVVTREELSDSVWGNGVNVDLEQSLNFCVRQIRSVLNDSASNPKFIDTLPKQGYRFIGDVEREAEQPAVAAVSVSGKSESLYGGSEVGIAVSGATGSTPAEQNAGLVERRGRASYACGRGVPRGCKPE